MALSPVLAPSFYPSLSPHAPSRHSPHRRGRQRPLPGGQRIQSRVQNAAAPGREGPAASAILKQPPLGASRWGRSAPAPSSGPHWPLRAEARPRLQGRPRRGGRLRAEEALCFRGEVRSTSRGPRKECPTELLLPVQAGSAIPFAPRSQAPITTTPGMP